MRGFRLQVRRRAGYFWPDFCPNKGLVGRTLEDQQVPVLFLMQTRIRPEVNEFPAFAPRRGQLCLEGGRLILPLLTPIVPWVRATVLYSHVLAIPVLLSCAHAEQPLVGELGLCAERLTRQVDVELCRREVGVSGPRHVREGAKRLGSGSVEPSIA